jgi:NIL domain
MLAQNHLETQFEPIYPTNLPKAPDDPRPTQTRIRICIPKQYRSEPVISRLISQHHLTVNVNAALLDANARDDGWFDLELIGTGRQIQSALIYLAELDIEIWSQSIDPESENW